MKKRVLLFSNMYPSEKNKTFGIFIKNQVEQLLNRGWDIKIIAISDSRSSKMHVIKKYLFWTYKAIIHTLLNGKRYDVVHVHYVFPAGLFGLLAKKIWKRRLVVTVHGGDIDKMARKNKYTFNWTKRILQGADHVICVGSALYQDLVKDFQVKENKLSIISMGVNQDIFYPKNKKDIKTNLNVAEKEKIILFVGNLIREKGTLDLLEAFQDVHSKHPSTRLHLVGNYKQTSFLEEVKEKMRQLEIEKSVVLHGPMPPKEVATWMNAAEMLVLPSWMEGFGLVALEAMSCGIPVLGTDVGGLSTLLDDNCGIKVPIKDPQKLATGMKELLHNPELVWEIVKNGLQRAEENNSELILDKVISIYKGDSKREQKATQ